MPRVFETIVIIGSDVYEKLPEKEKDEFDEYARYKRMNELEYMECNSETNEENYIEWEGDDCFDDMEELMEFCGEEHIGEIFQFVYTCCYKVFDEEEDKEYFEDLTKGVKGTQLKIIKRKQGWYKDNFL